MLLLSLNNLKILLNVTFQQPFKLFTQMEIVKLLVWGIFFLELESNNSSLLYIPLNMSVQLSVNIDIFSKLISA